ncbi:MAG: protoporphyrinogen oxidase HemJ [Alphaproteobacteria bacterium]|nr:protoporphyrinogen oxidase HemJ [Alphaproteobacteria bacterium]OJV14049.1 MAG: TIGR00701 family protein [Alphaproteobacteria bacterium 33-17]
MAEYYLLIKALHIISFTAWMAGMFYLPRLYVYHTKYQSGSETDQLFQTMERKLLRVIMNPAMIATFIFGIMLMYILGLESLGGWFHAKVTLVLIMAGCHGMLAKYRKDFEKGVNKKSEKFFRMLNEVPTVLMILIVMLVVLKPF